MYINLKYLLMACATTLSVQVAQAQTAPFPSKNISIIVPYSPGNGLDLLGRGYAEALRAQLQSPVILENKEGAAGLIGTLAVTRMAADGYHLLFTANPPYAVTPFAMNRQQYDPQKSLTPVARVGSVPLVLITSSRLPITSLASLKQFVQHNPGKATYASAGTGSPGQLYGELLNQATGLNLREIPYKSTGQGLTDVIAGTVTASLVSITVAAPHIKSGELRALAMGSRERLPAFDSVPTLAQETGKSGFEAGVWYGFLAPTGTPPDVVDTLYQAIIKAAGSERIQTLMKNAYMVSEVLDPKAFSTALATDVDLAKSLINDSKLRSK